MRDCRYASASGVDADSAHLSRASYASQRDCFINVIVIGAVSCAGQYNRVMSASSLCRARLCGGICATEEAINKGIVAGIFCWLREISSTHNAANADSERKCGQSRVKIGVTVDKIKTHAISMNDLDVIVSGLVDVV